MASITTIPTSGPAKPAMAGAAVMSQSLELDFRKSGNAKGHCNFGWSEPEDAETWMVGTSGTLVVPRPAAAVPHLLVLHLRPHVQHGRLPLQRLRVLVNGIFVAAFTLTDATTVRACEIPAAALRATPLMICFQTPDATRPSDISDSSDRRQLSVAFSALRLYPDQLHADPTGPGGSAPLTWAAPARPALAELMMQFESLGENCEFGLAQRRCAAEPLGLLRFASAPLPKLLEALLDGFSGMGAPGTIAAEISANGKEFMVQDNRYGLLYHAWVDAGAMTADEVVGREARRVPFLVRKILQELHDGEKIFVYKGMGAMREEEVFPLAAVLRRYGPNTLLFVTLADAWHPPGRVERRGPGFLVGYLERFAPGENAHNFELDPWIELCHNALRVRANERPSSIAAAEDLRGT